MPTGIHPLNILIVEDDLSYAMDLEILLEELNFSKMQLCTSGEDALDIAKQTKLDLILLDVGLGGEMDGLEFANAIKQFDIPILFITSYKDEETYAKTKQYNSVGYLVKPLDKITLKTTMELVTNHIKQNKIKELGFSLIKNHKAEKKIIVRKSDTYHKISTDEIIYFEADSEYIMLYTSESKYPLRHSVKQMEEELYDQNFFRVHKSYLVNINHLSSFAYEEGVITLSTSKKLPVSRRKKKELLTRWQHHVKP